MQTSEIERALDVVEGAIRGEPHLVDFTRHRARYAHDAALVGRILDGSTVLEIGSYPGHFTALLSVLGIPCVSVDIDPGRLGALRERFGLDVRRCDIEREPLPFADASLRHVTCNEVLEHLRVDPLFALSEMNRVLVPGGHLLLTTPNLYSVQQCARFVTGRGFGDPLAEFLKLRTLGHMGHVREYSHREVRRFLHHAGFRIERLEYRHYYFGAGKRGLIKRIVFAVVPRRFRTFQVIHARKAQDLPRLEPLP